MGEPKHYLIGRVREALASDPRVNDLNVNVTIAGDRVLLTGNVETQQRKDAITTVAREVLPDYEIHNQTTVEQFSETDEVEKLT